MSSSVITPEFTARVTAILDQITNLSKNYTIGANSKAEQQTKLVASVLDLVNNLKPSKATERAQLLCWKGRALEEAHPGYNAEAEECLSKAVKLEPSNVDAWVHLGQVFWKKKDLQAAKNCFRGALKQKPNKRAYCDLSMVYRVLGEQDESKERSENVDESVRLANEAVKLDLSDPYSWYVLGNAYFTQFFTSSKGAILLDKSLKAYDRATSLTQQDNNPDLYFNKGNVYKFKEHYQDAVLCYIKAGRIDPDLPTAGEVETINRYVNKIANLIQTNNGLKPKKVAALIKPLSARTKIGERKVLGLKDLHADSNMKTVLVGKVVAPVSRSTSTPVSFLILDKNGDMVPISIYNVADNVLNTVKVNDEVQILDPVLRQVKITPSDDSQPSEPQIQAASYPYIYVYSPITFYVNEKLVDRYLIGCPSACLMISHSDM